MAVGKDLHLEVRLWYGTTRAVGAVELPFNLPLLPGPLWPGVRRTCAGSLLPCRVNLYRLEEGKLWVETTCFLAGHVYSDLRQQVSTLRDQEKYTWPQLRVGVRLHCECMCDNTCLFACVVLDDTTPDMNNKKRHSILTTTMLWSPASYCDWCMSVCSGAETS